MKKINKFMMKWVYDITKTKIFTPLMITAFAFFGTLYIYNTWTTTINETSKHAMNTARTAVASFPKEALNKLDVSPKDIDNPVYKSIKSNLEELVKVNKDVRFAYIYTQKRDKIYFIADSEPVDSKDYSPPGQEYPEAFEEDKKPFQDGKPIITSPEIDRWGTWVSMLVPMKDIETGKTIAVFGMDYPAETWKTEAVSQTVQAFATVFGLFLLLVAFRIIITKNETMKASQNIILESERRLIAAQSMAHVGNWELDLNTKTIWASEETFNIYGINDMSQHLPLDLVQEIVFPEDRESLNNALIGLITRQKRYDEEFRIKNVKTGQTHFVHSKAILIVDETGNGTKVSGTLQDITERKEKEKEILYLGYHDKLTGVYNRRFYEEEIRRLDTERNLPISIIIGDVNGLKLLNDAFGHDKGDELLKKAAAFIQSACGTDDIVARWGGDEFIILLPKTTSEEAEKMVNRIRELYSNEHVNALSISISFGWDTKRRPDEDIQKVLKSAEDYMYKHKIIENKGIRSNTINTITNTLHEKNPREEKHSQRVSEICVNIGKVLGFSEIEINKLKVVGLLHDIGKIAIDEGILNKPGKLTEQERDEIERHPDIGYRILSSSFDMMELADCIMAHHERWDGAGYPKGLKGEAIPKVARIIAIADSYDAMTSERPYRKALKEEVALAEIRDNAGIQFDPELARLFVENVLEKQWDTTKPQVFSEIF